MNGLLAKVKVLDTKTHLCFESPIYLEEIVTNRLSIGRRPETTVSFSPVTVPDIQDWRAEWGDRSAKLRGLKGTSYMIDDVRVKKIIFSGPCTIILWEDGTKTIARVSDGDEFDPEKGVAVCFMKRILGHTDTNKLLRKALEQYWDERKAVDQIKEYLKEDKDERRKS